MLQITVPGGQWFDEATEKFVTYEPVDLELEHSLVALSKWEAVYEKPFLGPAPKTSEEVYGYIKAMTLTPEVPEEVFLRLSEENMIAINEHINRKMTATWFSDSSPSPKSKEIITAELIYYWLSAFQIDFAVETWHLNRLFTLIHVANLKNAKPKKMTRAQVAERNRKLNEERIAQMGGHG